MLVDYVANTVNSCILYQTLFGRSVHELWRAQRTRSEMEVRLLCTFREMCTSIIMFSDKIDKQFKLEVLHCIVVLFDLSQGRVYVIEYPLRNTFLAYDSTSY